MFVLSQQANVAYRAIAMLVASALVLWGIGAHVTAEAANLTSVSDTLSDSNPGSLSDHVIAFTIPAGSNGIDADDEQIIITLPDSFDLTSDGDGAVDFSDFDMTVAGADQTLAAAVGSGQWGVSFSGTNNTTITLETTDNFVTAGQEVIVTIGHQATGGTANSQIENPSATTSYEVLIDVAGTQDVGRTRVAIVENVLVTAVVDTVFDFLVRGFDSAGIDANGTSTTGTSSATALPFGTLAAGSIETLAQRLTVTTNAIQGYVVTVEQDQNLLSSTGADIDGFIDGAYTDTPSDWASPSNSISNENTWGHWALTSTDDHDNGNGTFQSCAGAANGCWVSASTTPREIMSHNGPADGVTNDIGSSTIGYQIEISPLQEAADDYNTTLTYIATPTF